MIQKRVGHSKNHTFPFSDEGSATSEVEWMTLFWLARRCDIGITTIWKSNYYHNYLCTANIRPNGLKIENYALKFAPFEMHLLTGRSFWCINLGAESSYDTMQNELSFWGLIFKSCQLMSLANVSAIWMHSSTRQRNKWSWVIGAVLACRKVRYTY